MARNKNTDTDTDTDTPDVPATKTIIIQKEPFEVSCPFTADTPMTDILAKVLNQSRAENIANNQRSAVKKAIEEGTLDEYRAGDFAEYDAIYEFTEASTGSSKSTMTPVEKEAKSIANGYVIKHLKESNRNKKDVDPDAFAAEVARLAATSKVLAMAEKRVAEMDELAEVKFDLPDLESLSTSEGDEAAAA